MTELVEGVALGKVRESDIDCPFHDARHTCSPKPKNELEGNATKLGVAIVEGELSASTVVRKDDAYSAQHRELHQENDPDERKLSAREVQLIRKDKDTWYPVGFQAHHLIPAAESLARAKTLLKFIRGGNITCCPLGYDVNGNQNGVWLPGKHAVDGNGLDLWKGGAKPSPDEDGGRKKICIADRDGKWSYRLLTGKRPGVPGAFGDDNMRWLYVQKAMNSMGKRQFHDRHPNYSRAVLSHLNSLGSLLQRLSGVARPAIKAECGKCRNEERRMPPVALLGTLNGLSEHYRGKVLGSTEDRVFYTSSWCDPGRRPFRIVVKRKRVAPRAKG